MSVYNTCKVCDSSIKLINEKYNLGQCDKSQSLKLNTIIGDFNVMDKIEETFDVITLWEVLIHQKG